MLGTTGRSKLPGCINPSNPCSSSLPQSCKMSIFHEAKFFKPNFTPKKLSTWAGNSMLAHADQHPCHHYSIHQLCCLLQHHASRHLNDDFNAIRVFGFGQIYECTIPQHNIEQFCGAKVNQRTILHPITNKQTRISDFHLFIEVELYHHGTMSML